MDTPDEMSPEDYGRRLYVEGTSAGLSAEEMQAITKDALLEVRGSRHRNTIPDGNPDKVPTIRPPTPKKRNVLLPCVATCTRTQSCDATIPCAILEIAPCYRALFVDPTIIRSMGQR